MYLAIPHKGIYPIEIGDYVYQKTCTRMVMTALFTMATEWKPRYPSTEEWIYKL